jgi:DNA-binding NarL/FixJ family response regulator
VRKEVKIVVCDHHDVCRRALRLLLEEQADFRVIGAARPGSEIADAVGRLRPDVVVLDANPSCGDGETTVYQLSQVSHTVILTGAEDEELMSSSLRAGASGFLVKSDPICVITEAIRQVAAGAAVLSPRMTRKMLDRTTAPLAHLTPSPHHGLDLLTTRELEMLRCLARGLSNREIAGEIGIAVATVKAHVSRLLAKLSLRDRAAAVVFAYEVGLVRPGAQPARV